MDLLHEQDGNYTEASFSVAARVALQLGRESISNSIIAITELVKNSYDADAEHVILHFINTQSANPLLIIEDDGIGMDKDQIINQWMVIGTSNKKDTKKSKIKDRVFAGEKGLGRLGLDRLCTTSIIQSFTEENDEGVNSSLIGRNMRKLKKD